MAAETLQVKGLANVRNKYEQGQIQKGDSSEDIKPDISSPLLPSEPMVNTVFNKYLVAYSWCEQKVFILLTAAFSGGFLFSGY